MSNPLTGQKKAYDDAVSQKAWRFEEIYPPSSEAINQSGGLKGWKEIKSVGSDHYKTEGVEPIDLIKDLGLLRNFAIANIIKYASRNACRPDVKVKDMNKIIHYAEMLKSAYGGEE